MHLRRASDRRDVVVIVVSNLEYGGAQRQIVELANHIDRRRFELHVVSLSDYVPLAGFLDNMKSRFHIIQKRNKYDVTVPFRLASLLRKVRARIVHGYLFDADIATRIAGLLAATRVVANSERNTDYSLKRVQRAAYFLTRPLVNLVIANSNAGARFNRNALGHRASIYYTVHNGVDTNRFKPADSAIVRKALGIPDDNFVIGMFGSFKEQKNHPMLFNAVATLQAKIPNMTILLVGDELAGGMHGSTAYQTRVNKLVADLGLRERCVFAGNRDDVENLYPACDITVLPSLFEGTPNVALESMSCGVPVIATDVSDNGYVIKASETGYLVPLHDENALADGILRLAGDTESRRTMGKNAREWMIQEFSCERLARKTEQVYLYSLGLPAPGAPVLKSF